MLEDCRVKKTLPSSPRTPTTHTHTPTPKYTTLCVIKVLLVLDGSKLALQIDGCWLVAMETALPWEFMIDHEIPVPPPTDTLRPNQHTFRFGASGRNADSGIVFHASVIMTLTLPVSFASESGKNEPEGRLSLNTFEGFLGL